MKLQGCTVFWTEDSAKISGVVKKAYAKEIHKTINGTEVSKKGSFKNMALLIKAENGEAKLMLESEVQIIPLK